MPLVCRWLSVVAEVLEPIWVWLWVSVPATVELVLGVDDVPLVEPKLPPVEVEPVLVLDVPGVVLE